MKFDKIEITTSKTYVDLMKRSADAEWERRRDEDYMSIVTGLTLPSGDFSATTTLDIAMGKVQYGYLIQQCAEVYKHTGEKEYADIALEVVSRLVKMLDWVTANLKPETRVLDNMQFIEAGFAGGPFMKGLLLLRQMGVMDDRAYRAFQPVAESSVRYAMRLPEWGPFNRCVLRMSFLDRFAALYPDSEYAADARKLADFLVWDSIGRWNMEDTPQYNGIWYITMAEYFNEHPERCDYRSDEVMRFYAVYMAHLLTPEGSIPDYGDSNPRDAGCPALSIGFLEWAAVRFNDGKVKYAVMKYMAFIDKFYKHNIAGGWYTRTYALAADMCAEKRVRPVKPDLISGECIDDLISKKIVFRGENRDYMLLNYRDQGGYALPARQNMYATIPAPAEKVHHGHADENSICSLMYKDKMLLTDGGYRDRIVADGHYRADFYHNRVVLRNGRIFREKGFLDYAEDLGAYLKVETEKLFYHEINGLEISRTRLTDTHHKAVYDRTVAHFGDGIYAVIDKIRATEDYEYTLGQMWFGGKITKVADSDYLIKQTLDKFKGPRGTDSLALRTVFVRKGLPVSVEKIRRCYDDNQYALTQYYSEYLGRDENLCFVTLLMPEDASLKARNDAIAASAEYGMSDNGKGVWLSLTVDGRKYTLCEKCDERYGFGDLAHRPTYSFDRSKITYGSFTTDALLAVFTEQGSERDYSVVMSSGLEIGGKSVWKSEMNSFSNNDLTVNYGAINFPRWDGKF